jgi:hypothetical protein
MYSTPAWPCPFFEQVAELAPNCTPRLLMIRGVTVAS